MKYKYRTRIYDAWNEALGEHEPFRTTYYDEYRSKGDDAPLHLREERDQWPGQIVVPTLQEFRILRKEHVALSGFDPQEEWWRKWLDQDEEHEVDHSRAAKKLGAKAIQHGIRSIKVVKEGVELMLFHSFIKMPDFKTTKLGYALVLMHPMKPSGGDREVAFKELGYPNVRVLKDKARQRGMPVPQGN